MNFWEIIMALFYLGVMLAAICVWFLLFKRPIYESVFVSFIVLIAVTNTWAKLPEYIDSALSNSLLYSMTAFVAMSIVLTKTKIIDGCIAIVLSLVGRVRGGAGYASVVASAFMGALSGSGPGNVMATGTITIPAMKRSGFPAELAANIESTSSYLGNMIPPSSNIVAALGAFVALYPDAEITTGQFWVVLWGISVWFIIQRIITVWGFCRYYKVKPMPKEELPRFSEAVKKNWQGLLLPIVILLPFVLDFIFKDGFFTERLGAAGAKAFSGALLLCVPGIVVLFALFIKGREEKLTPVKMADMFASGVKSIVPVVSTCIFGYAIGALYAELDVAAELQTMIDGLGLGRFMTVIVITLMTCFLGMVIPGSSIVVIFGPVIISTFAAVGINPLLAAAMLPCICGVMSGITPPLALGMYAGMSIAESDFAKTVKNDLWWVALQYLLQVVVLMGWLPIIGLGGAA